MGFMRALSNQNNGSSHLIHWGSEDCPPGHEYGGVRDYYLLHMVSKGKGEYQCSGRKWTLTKGDAFLIFPGQKHLYKADTEEPWSYFWLGFQGNFDGIFTSLRLNKNSPVLHCKNVEELQHIFSGISEPRLYKHPAEELENLGRFNLILGKLFRQRHAVQPVPQKTDSGSSHHVQSMETFIHEYYNTPIQVQDVIDFVQLERSYASRIFKEKINKSIGEVLRDDRFDKAQEYLRSGWSAKEAAYSCGFRDYNNFLKAFKKRTGMTPGAYKLDFSSHSVSTDD
ncbi:AraC family transcriptional regulator [Oceanispirochaeta sp. M1]|nr:AraC family transcriptional regulator [Oceanispirochaeta sp. M1]